MNVTEADVRAVTAHLSDEGDALDELLGLLAEETSVLGSNLIDAPTFGFDLLGAAEIHVIRHIGTSYCQCSGAC